MNNRPTHAPAPSQTATAERTEDATFQVAQSSNLPAARANGNTPPAHHEHVEREPVTLPKTGFAALAAGIAAVMAEIKPVAKSGWNDFHKYNYARMQDLSAELTPLMGKHGVVVFQNELNRDMFDDGRAMAVRYEFTIVHKSGEIWPERPVITGVSMCRTSKGTYDDKAFNKCHTSARKYFLLSLFQIPTDDEEDADNGPSDSRQRPQQQSRRPVPSPSGKVSPHFLPIIDGEAPEAWATRFTEFINKAETEAEIDQWYDLNAPVFGKLKGRFQEVYDDLVDAMDARTASLKTAKESTKAVTAAPQKDDLALPPELDRREKKAPAPPADGISDKERDWLSSLEEAFGVVDDIEILSEEQRSIMLPSKDSVGGVAWNKAVDILNKHIERIEQRNG